MAHTTDETTRPDSSRRRFLETVGATSIASVPVVGTAAAQKPTINILTWEEYADPAIKNAISSFIVFVIAVPGNRDESWERHRLCRGDGRRRRVDCRSIGLVHLSAGRHGRLGGFTPSPTTGRRHEVRPDNSGNHDCAGLDGRRTTRVGAIQFHRPARTHSRLAVPRVR